MIAVGVASPMAQGQAMSSTETAVTKAKLSAGSGPKMSQAAKVRMAMAMTTGTKIAATLSASCWIGGLEPWASSTILMIWLKTVSAPTRVARKVKLPVPLTVPPTTSAPGPFSAGIGSPLIIDSSTKLAPSVTTPSTGTRSPGRSTTRSPGATAEMAISCSSPPRITRAVLAWRRTSALIASEVRPLATASR